MKYQKLELLCKKTLLEHLDSKKTSITKISKAIGCHPATIYNWMKDEKTLSLRLWDKIMEYLTETFPNEKNKAL